MPLVYLPQTERLFHWRASAAETVLPDLDDGVAARVVLLTPEGVREVEGVELPLVATLERLALIPAAQLTTLPSSIASWALASKLSLELLARERVAPRIARRDGRVEARWGAALAASDDAEKAAEIARGMSPAAHAVPLGLASNSAMWSASALLRAFLDAAVDAMVRASQGAPSLPSATGATGATNATGTAQRNATSWDARWRSALSGAKPDFEAQGFAERSLLEDLERWSEPALGGRDRPRTCFRLELPEADSAPFRLVFLLQSLDDPSLLVPAAELWGGAREQLEKLGHGFENAQAAEETLLEALGRAARLYPPLAPALDTAKPSELALDATQAWAFLAEGAPLLAEAGFRLIVPSELTAAGQRRLRLRSRVGGKTTRKVAGAVGGTAGLGLDELLTVDWEAVIGEQALTARELSALAKHKAPLVRFRGAWTAVDPAELAAIQARIASGPSRLSTREAIQAALSGELQQGALSASVVAGGDFEALLARLRGGAAANVSVPAALQATLRPYQERGLAWLDTLAALGLGACLADDMGLGKTIQLLAFLLRLAERGEASPAPALLVAPTSVLGNWQREAQRFAPSLPVIQHYGSERVRSAVELTAQPGALVLTSYGLLRRDAELLANVPWRVVALDEAQHIKNAASSTARAARGLPATHRIALTGTPVENRLAELWSILEFANPGLLGPLEIFRRTFAVPIERYGNEHVAARLRKLVDPFVLRRLKSDPSIISDLPAKNEAKVVCTLTREQASLYKAVVDQELTQIEQSEGVERKGRVLALLTRTKQICNHPAQYLGESGPLAKRSGKLERISEMLEEALATGDKVLIFSQFREMAERLVAHFKSAVAGSDVLLLHGGTSKSARDEMVQRFQAEGGPNVFVLSLKAGGTGLNLTAANHVFHYDRWWNPAVEDQATDRAYRIGQKRAVQVHKLVCAGTVEDKIDQLLEQKRKLAARVVGAGENWITELDDSGLRDLFALSASAVSTNSDDDEDAPAESTTKKPRAKRSAEGRA